MRSLATLQQLYIAVKRARAHRCMWRSRGTCVASERGAEDRGNGSHLGDQSAGKISETSHQVRFTAIDTLHVETKKFGKPGQLFGPEAKEQLGEWREEAGSRLKDGLPMLRSPPAHRASALR